MATDDEGRLRGGYAEIKTQRERLAVRPAPLFSQQQQVLTSLVAKWVAGFNRAEDGTRTRYPQPRSVRTLRVSTGGLDLLRVA